MAHITSEVLNYFKLDLLSIRSYSLLRRLFKNRYTLFNNGQLWDESPTCGNKYVIDVISKSKKVSLTPIQKASVSSGNSDEWDITIFISLLLFIDRPKTLTTNEIQQLDQEDTLLRQLKEIRNKLAHNPTKSVNNIEFNKIWNDLTAILIGLGGIDVEFDRLKDDNVFEPPKQPINEENVAEAVRVNSLGTQAYKDEKYNEAIAFFTKATVLAGILNQDRAVFFANLAAARLSLHKKMKASVEFEFIDDKDERYRALRDAKQARNLWPTWWKGHFRVGTVYAYLNEHEKAINSFERALVFDPTKNEIQTALDESRIVVSRKSQPIYLDPKLYTKSIPELLQEANEKLGIDPKIIRTGKSLIEEIDPSAADVFRAHKYELGDIDVQQDYEKAAQYFAKAADQGNAEGMFNLARLTDRGLGVKKDHGLALKLLEQAAGQPSQHPIFKRSRNIGVAEAEHALGVRYFEGITVRKDLSVAAYWYQRATDHGSHLAPNNLGSMYLDGLAVDKDLEKAEQLFELGAERGDPLAMQTLAELLLLKNNFRMAEAWYDRACESGNIFAKEKRDEFAKQVEMKKQSSKECLMDDELTGLMEYRIRMLKTKHVPSVVPHYSFIENSKILNEYANRGSITAKKLCDALVHFMKALNILLEFEILTEQQENAFVHELSQCYRIEHIVAQIPGHMHKRISDVIDRVLSRCTAEQNNNVASQLDEDVRICYATLHISSYTLINEFLGSCKQKYPKSIYFFLIAGAVNGFLRHPGDGLYNINNGLELEPNNYELLYHKAVLLRHLNQNMNEIIEAYRTFLKFAPKDHRKVPEVYYEMGICYIRNCTSDVEIDCARKLYTEGQEAEKLQLPCFLPYRSENLPYLKPLVDENFRKDIKVIPDKSRKARLTDRHRVEVITSHRTWEHTILLQNDNSKLYAAFSYTSSPRIKQQTAKSLIGLKPITLHDMNPMKDHVYNGYALSVTIIEGTYSYDPSIHLVIEDENFDCERMLIYGFPKEQGKYLITKVYTVGCKMHIINPYLQIGVNDRKPAIRVDDISSIVMQSESERILNMCRYCCEANASKRCAKCQKAYYCSKECQSMDWKLFMHKLVCSSK